MAKIVLFESQERRLSRMLRWFEGQYGTSGETPGGGAMPLLESSVTFYNDSGETIPAYGIVELKAGGTLSNLIPYYKASKPTSTEGKQYAVNDAVPVEAKKYGQCFTSGEAKFKYDSGAPVIGDFYGAYASNWTAKKDGIKSFIQCLGITDATNKIAQGVIGSSSTDIKIGILGADLTYHTSSGASVTVKTGAPGSETGSDTITAYDWLLASGKKIASGAYVVCANINGYYYVINSSTCPVDA